jgi:hypothetical protein
MFTKTQIAILNKMWDMPDMESLNEFIESLPPFFQKEALSLKQIIILQCIDDDIDEMIEFPEATKTLNDLKLF